MFASFMRTASTAAVLVTTSCLSSLLTLRQSSCKAAVSARVLPLSCLGRNSAMSQLRDAPPEPRLPSGSATWFCRSGFPVQHLQNPCAFSGPTAHSPAAKQLHTGADPPSAKLHPGNGRALSLERHPCTIKQGNTSPSVALKPRIKGEELRTDTPNGR